MEGRRGGDASILKGGNWKARPHEYCASCISSLTFCTFIKYLLDEPSPINMLFPYITRRGLNRETQG